MNLKSAFLKKRALSIGLFIWILQPWLAYTQTSSQKWVNYSKSFYITDIDIEGDFVWVSSWGGLARFDKTNNTVTNFDGANSGLTNNYITNLVVADNGVKWIGTQRGGLVNFDGTNWNAFHAVNATDSITYVHKMAKDYDNNLWIASAPSYSNSGVELFKYDGNNFVKYVVANSSGNSNSIKTMTCDTLNNLWVITTGLGNNALRKFDGTNWVTYDTSNSAIGGKPEDLIVDSNGNIWIITSNGSIGYLTKFDGINFTNYPITTITTYAALHVDSNNDIWLSGVGFTGLRKFNGSNFTTVTGLPFSNITALSIDTGGNYFAGFWAANDEIFYGYDAATNNWTGHIVANSKIDKPYGRAVAVDQNGVRWITTITGALNRFDGTTWQHFSSSNSPLPSDDISSLHVDQNNSLWIGVYSTGASPLVRFDGTNWQFYPLQGLYPSGNGGWVRDIDEDINGNIWVATSDGIAKFDGNNWSYFNSVLPINSPYSITSITADNNNAVWATTNGEGILKYDGVTWSLYTSFNSGLANNQCGKIAFDANNHLWVSTNTAVTQRFDGTNWITYPPSVTGLSYAGVGIYTNPLDYSIWFCSNLNGAIKYDGNTWEQFNEFNSGICAFPWNVAFDKYNNKWFSTWNAGVSVFNENGINYETIYNIPSKAARGTVYYDQNVNGNFDTGDHGVAGRKLFLLPDSSYTFTNSVGAYSFMRNPGNYEIEYLPDPTWFLSSDSSKYHVTIDSVDVTGLDFGTAYTGFENNMTISLAAFNDRCSIPSNQLISYQNIGTTIVNGEIRLVKNSLFDFISSVPSPVNISADTITWDFQSLLQYEERQILVLLNNPGPQPIGTLLKSYAVISTNQTDVAADTIHQEIRCSFDPNDKLVFPPGHGPLHEVLTDDTLSYTIRFQNTGNDTAFFVFLIDTISQHLDMSTLEMKSSSHPVTVSASANGIVTFRFDDINLLWSSFNEPASHGFVKFKIKQKTNLQPPVTITNRAYIYFDFNAAIETNITSVTVVNALTNEHEIAPGKPDFQIFPNPANGRFTILMNTQQELYDLTVFDFSSKIVYKKTKLNSTSEIQLSGISSGMYTVEVRMNNGSVFYEKLAVCK